MIRRFSFAIALCILLSACGGGRGGPAPLQKPELQKPGESDQAPRPNPDGLPESRRTPGAIQPLQAEHTPPSGPPPPISNLQSPISSPASVEDVAPVSEYDAAQMIATFAGQYLGLGVEVSAVRGAAGAVAIPETARTAMNAAVAVAGQVAAGGIAAGEQRGAAEVAVGSGTVTGDLDADISGASQGAYSLVVRSAPPPDAEAALGLLRATYPALASLALQEQASSGGAYVFYATTTHPGVDWQSRQATTVAEAVLAGTTRQGPATIVWVVVANGEFATTLQP